MSGSLAKQLKPALHHWWPRGLSKYWADADGNARQVSSDGSIVRSFPKSFGAIKNAHHVDHGVESPWNFDFETKFATADSNFPSLATWLLALETETSDKNNFSDRFLPQMFSNEQRKTVAQCLASLIVRSPRYRYLTKITAEQYRGGVPANKALISANIHRCYEAITRNISSGGKFVALISPHHDLETVFYTTFHLRRTLH